MGLDFDLKTFIEDMRACKPPYKCPFDDCAKVYKTFSGIHLHIQSHEGGGGGNSGARTPAPTGGSGRRSPAAAESKPFFRSPQKDSLVFNECDKTLEFEADGGYVHKLSVYDALELVSKEDYEASLPPEALEPPKKPEEPKTPAFNRISNKKGKKTPKSAVKPDPAGVRDSGGGGGGPGGPGEGGGAEGKKMLKLPEAHYKEIDDYDIEDAPPMPAAYYRFIEKPAEELDEEVEYDMDEEDVAWLNIINEKRSSENLSKITEDQFELLMDRLEKESYFHVQSNGKDYSAPIDDDAICCVCMDGECSNTNVILFCDLCNLAVHQECYGVPYIPEGQWLCRRCLQSPSRSVECCLCPNRGGAFKQTDDGRWAHVVCGLWIPEVRFANTVFLEPIDSIDHIPPARWKLSCRVCKQRGVGACIQCHKTNCYTAFHVTCGLLAGLHMKMDTVRESSASGLSVTVRKTAYCDVHTPLDSDCKPKLDDIAALGIQTPKQKGAGRVQKKSEGASPPLPVLFRGLMNFSPQCPWDKVQEIASLINVQRKNQFFQRLMAYWTLKRQTRNGVPLIRRLQFAKATRSDRAPETPQKNAHHSKKKKKQKEEDSLNSEIVKKTKDELHEMIEQRKLLRRLRQDLERVRLLCELIRKREQRKRELIVAAHQVVELKCFPYICFLRRVMDNLQEIDTQQIFAEPVDINDVPDYLNHIKCPMDFRTMREKLDSFEYEQIDKLEADFNQMVQNCLTYNERDTIYFRAGVKMRDAGGSIIRQARRHIDIIGFEPETGLHLSEPRPVASNTEEVSDDILMRDIDAFLGDENRESMPREEHLKKLLDYHDKASLLHHPVAKLKRLKILKQEIKKERRNLSMDRAGTSPGFKKILSSYVDSSAEDGDNSEKETTKKEEETSSNVTTPASRRLRPGKEAASVETSEKKSTKKGRGKKRALSGNDEDETPDAKRWEKEENATTPASSSLKTPTKVVAQCAAASSATKSPIGVNRRNAVLFTRKKQAAAVSTPEPREDDSDDGLENRETEVQSPAPVISTPVAAAATLPSTSFTSSGPGEKKKRGRKPKNPPPGVKSTLEQSMTGLVSTPASYTKGQITVQVGGPDTIKSPRTAGTSSGWRGPPKDSASFQVYRHGGEISGETDDDTQSGSATDVIATSEDDDNSSDNSDDEDEDSSSDDDSSATSSTHRIPLEPLDLVWAKCRGYPWYPALIINPKMPRTGYLHNGVPIPVPPQEVLDMANSHTSPHYLILFFDAKRTWQWLTRDKLEPLGVDSELDKAKLVQSKKPSEKKAVKKAYEDAILHRCRVTGENATVLSDGDESNA